MKAGLEEIMELSAVEGAQRKFTRGYIPGERMIREEAAQLALENDVSSVWAEFGVSTGSSAYFLGLMLPKEGQFFLFDSFEGLPEDWAQSEKYICEKGKFSCDVPKFRNERLIVVPGWFEDTLPHESMSGPLGLIHIDSDLYSSCKTIFERLDDQIVPGTIILFDELYGYDNWRDGEYRALAEWHREFRFIVRDTEHRVIIEVCT